MELTLVRRGFDPGYTSGKLFVDGEPFCDTLEHPARLLPIRCPDTVHGQPCTCPQKIPGHTAVPAGIYRVTMEYSPHFRRRIPCLHQVPHFLGILIHPGNSVADSAGCILVGSSNRSGTLAESRKWSDRLNGLLEKEQQILICIR